MYIQEGLTNIIYVIIDRIHVNDIQSVRLYIIKFRNWTFIISIRDKMSVFFTFWKRLKYSFPSRTRSWPSVTLWLRVRIRDIVQQYKDTLHSTERPVYKDMMTHDILCPQNNDFNNAHWSTWGTVKLVYVKSLVVTVKV